MGRPSDQSELPRPELNPLLNPRLAENMGRWAEVYFTAPPEKREEAVLDLLRELESQGDSAKTAFPSADLHPAESRAPQHAFAEPSAAAAAAALERVPTLRCPTCGHDNPQSHQFCGMCGITLDAPTAPRDNANRGQEKGIFEGNGFDAGPFNQDDGFQEQRPGAGRFDGSRDAGHRDAERFDPDRFNPESFNEDRFNAEHRHDDDRESVDRDVPRLNADAMPSFREAPAESDELSLFRSISGGGYNEKVDWTDESNGSPSYRGYIGIALAVILLSLGYLFWRSSQASQSAHQVPAAPPVAAPETSAAAAANTPQTATASPAASTPSPADAPATKAVDPAANASETKAPPRPAVHEPAVRESAVREPAVRRATDISATTVTSGTGNGGEELATAERYLSGGNGQARDSAEAAKWLWKSVAKHNSAASLQLADLYLKGDGVSKNCDQARVLLDAAALQGVPGAGERLRHLPAFGCQ